MNAALILQNMPLLVILCVIAMVDVRFRRIPNAITLPLILGALAEAYFGHHGISMQHALLGCLVGFVLTFGPFLIGAMGGGDVKLMAAVGTWTGPVGALAVFMLAAVVGLVMVLTQSIKQGRTSALIRNSAVITINLLHLRELGAEQVQTVGESCRSIDEPLPYAVPVMVGVLLLVAMPWLSWLVG